MNKSCIRSLLVVLLLASTVSLMLAGYSQAGRWLNTASCLLALAAIAQLNVSGFFDIRRKEYSDKRKFPKGPPSHFVQEIIENPETPFLTWLRRLLFFDMRFGQGLVIASILVQLVAAWIA